MTGSSWDSELVADARASAARMFAANEFVGVEAFAAMGWEELVLAHPALAITVLSQEAGRQLSGSRVLELALRHGLSTVDAPPVESSAVVLPHSLAPFHDEPTVTGLAWVDGPDPIDWIVPVRRDDVVVLLHVAGHQGSPQPVVGLDPERGLSRVTIDLAGATPLPCNWTVGVNHALMSLAAELVGLASAMIEVAREHVVTRHQFGVPLGAFQVVQHRLADTHVAVEAAQSLLEWDTVDHTSTASATAALAAHHAFDLATSQCSQVLGAMGSTWEHSMHRYVRRGHAVASWIDLNVLAEIVRAGLGAAAVELEEVW
ncbi:hypothetical protein GCM10022234_05190 [Aeromicrobium panaciterrae]|uniref:acyl-CoA dehydrogenase family protein n=1 Tax=Aeromicrobium panaciterrae TaxID=363861 RepID=UPI0031D38D9A